jgi:hypothetical protein
MVIFGAGASHDMDPSAPPDTHPDLVSRTPLSSDLFGAKYATAQHNWSDFRGILSELRQASLASADPQGPPAVENLLQVYQDDADSRADRDRRVQLAAVRFYLRDLAQGWSARQTLENNYVSLLDRINHRRWLSDSQVALVTFNYETLLESALAIIQHRNPDERLECDVQLSEYLAPDRQFAVFKPHGSWQWAREVTGHSIANAPIRPVDLIRNVDSLEFGDRYFCVDRPDAVFIEGSERTVVFPWLALPLRSKDFAWPPAHSGVLDRCIADVTHLICVGWRAQEAHFLARWKLARRPLRGIQIITRSGEGAVAVESRLQEAGIGSLRVTKVHGGFTEYIKYLRQNPLDGFLSS